MARELEPDDPRYIPDDLADRMREEQTVMGDTLTVTDVEAQNAARKLFYETAAQAAATITQIAQHGTTERVRLDAAKYVVERVLGRLGEDTGSIDPLTAFMTGVEVYANAGRSEES